MNSPTSTESPKGNWPSIGLLVLDLDNTLYDWVSSFVESFYAMLRVATETLAVPEETLLDDLQEVHRRYGNSEHPFALLETRSASQRFPGWSRTDVKRELDRAFHAFNSRRKETLHPYPGVVETLMQLRTAGVPIVAHTEATAVNALHRLQALDLESFFVALYAVAPPAQAHPDPERSQARQPPFSIRHVASDERKPDPRILLEICRDFAVAASRTLYVGDSVARDIAMAQAAGTLSAWAEYGTKYDPCYWKKLVRVTHWTAADVERAKLIQEKAQAVRPDAILKSRFSELLELFTFAGAKQQASV